MTRAHRIFLCAVAACAFLPALAGAMQKAGGEEKIARPAGDPLEELWRMQERMNGVIDEVYGRLGMTEQPRFAPGYISYYPSSDVSENDKEVIVRIDLPGVEKDKVDISFSEGNLMISGTREVVKEEHRAASWFMQERSFGSFERVIPVRPAIRESGITASYKDGVLTVILPKAEVAAPPARKIKIL